MKCEIRSSCSLPGCQHTDPITVDPDSNITRNCSISTGKRAQGMTWKLARQEVQNSTALSDLVLLQSKSKKDIGNMSCDCTNIDFARRCFFGSLVVNGRPWTLNLGEAKKRNRCLVLSKQLTNRKHFSCTILDRVSEQNQWLWSIADLLG